MSLMGWSSESMAARYQHVTDALRSQVASQVGDLIWDSRALGGEGAAVMIGCRALAVLLAVVEEHVTGDCGDSEASADVLAAIAEIRAALPDAAEPARTSNETKTETRRSSDG